MHVPEESLGQYRSLRKIAEQFGTLGAIVSGKGMYADAHTCWALEAKYQRLANELRVPGKNEKEQGNASDTAANQGTSPGDSEPSPGDS